MIKLHLIESADNSQIFTHWFENLTKVFEQYHPQQNSLLQILLVIYEHSEFCYTYCKYTTQFDFSSKLFMQCILWNSLIIIFIIQYMNPLRTQKGCNVLLILLTIKCICLIVIRLFDDNKKLIMVKKRGVSIAVMNQIIRLVKGNRSVRAISRILSLPVSTTHLSSISGELEELFSINRDVQAYNSFFARSTTFKSYFQK